MSDMEKELDATMEKARQVLEETDRLAAAAGKAVTEKEAWNQENGITPEILDTFAERLDDEGKKVLAEEEEKFARELEHDTDAALDRAKADSGTVVKPRARKFV